MINDNKDKALLNEIGKIIKNLRNAKGITQKELAYGLCDDTTLSRIENGTQKTLDLLLISKLVRKLDLDLEMIIKNAETNIKDQLSKIKKQIYTLVSLGKCSEAQELTEEYLDPLRNAEEYKYHYYVKGSVEFYNKNYELAKKYFLLGLKDLDINNYVSSFIEILLINAYLSYCFEVHDFSNELVNKYFEIYVESIEFYTIYDLKLMLRYRINLASIFRMMNMVDKAERLLKETEDLIDANKYIELKLDLNLERINLYIQCKKEFNLQEMINKLRSIIKASDLPELEIYMDNKIEEIIQARNDYLKKIS